MFRKLIASAKAHARAVALSALVALSVFAPLKEAHATGATSNYLQNEFVDWFFRGQTYTPPSTMYVALATSSASASACGTEVTGGSYARASISSSLANWAGTQSAGSTVASTGTSGTTSNNGTITFATPTASWGTVTYLCVYDASSGGNYLWYTALTSSQTISSGNTVSFSAAALSFQLQ